MRPSPIVIELRAIFARQLDREFLDNSSLTFDCPLSRARAEKYKNQGLMVIGVHPAEFAFEKHIDNVAAPYGHENRLSYRHR